MKIVKILIFIAGITSVGCTKDFLDAKPSSELSIPATLDNFESLLEGNAFTFATSALPILSADEYKYISYQAWQSTPTATERNSYIWEKDIYGGSSTVDDWALPYTAIFYANNVLAGLDKMNGDAKNTAQWSFLRGWALFERAYYLYDLARNFCKSYRSSTSTADLGLPLKLSPDISDIRQRSTLEQTYSQILADLAASRKHLDAYAPVSRRNRPSLPAVFALQARIFLSMGRYGDAEAASDSCLRVYSKLLDYRTLPQNTSFPFDKSNLETIFSTSTTNSYLVSSSLLNPYINVHHDVLDLYSQDDLRKKLYFKVIDGRTIFNGNYSGLNLYPFTGLATDEVYLIKAECAARKGDISGSLKTLNSLLELRFPTESFRPLTALTSTEALKNVLDERRKELVWHGLRWSDLKRLNAEGSAISLKRSLDNKQYELLPNDPRWVFPIPVDEIILSQIEQNPR